MQARGLALLAGAGSLALLLAAFSFQHLGGLAPCKMCIWQRYPHAIAVALGLAAVFASTRHVALPGALAALATAGIGAYHVGVEQNWWEGPSTCSGADIGELTPDALLDQIMNAPLVRCDEIAWQLMGISMAGWNALASLALLALWLTAYRKAV